MNKPNSFLNEKICSLLYIVGVPSHSTTSHSSDSSVLHGLRPKCGYSKIMTSKAIMDNQPEFRSNITLTRQRHWQNRRIPANRFDVAQGNPPNFHWPQSIPVSSDREMGLEKSCFLVRRNQKRSARVRRVAKDIIECVHGAPPAHGIPFPSSTRREVYL